MLKKINRLSQDTEFKYVKENGRMMRTPLFGLLWTTNEKVQITNNKLQANSKSQITKEKETAEDTRRQDKKVGFIISKKISKRAVDRNRIKRLLAEVVRNNIEKLPQGFRGIFLVTRQMLGRKYEDVEKEINKISVFRSQISGKQSK